MTDEWQAGDDVAGRFRLVRRLGHGGMSSVWEARHLALRAPVAVKFLASELASDRRSAGRFTREARAAAALRSANVVQTLDYGVDRGVPYIVLELLHGETLAERLARQWRLTYGDTAWILSQVARAVARAHAARIVHRDLKPANVFVAREDEREIVKVLDFGIAKAAPAEHRGTTMPKTATGAVLGTPSYVSPEQARGAREVDWRTDIWSFGIVAYECLLGTKPFSSAGSGEVLVNICEGPIPVPSDTARVPPDFDQWFARAVHRDIGQRFQSIRQAAEELERILLAAPSERAVPHAAEGVPATLPASQLAPGTEPSVATQPAPFRRPGNAQRRVALVGLGALGVTLVLVAGVAAGWMVDAEVDTPDSSIESAAIEDAPRAVPPSASGAAALPVRAGLATPADSVPSIVAARVNDATGAPRRPSAPVASGPVASDAHAADTAPLAGSDPHREGTRRSRLGSVPSRVEVVGY